MKTILSFGFCLGMAVNLLAQSRKNELFQLFSNAQFQRFSMSNGMPSDNCFRVTQTHDGAIWMATMHGVARFNGYNWLYFQQEINDKHRQIASNWVMDITPSKTGVWLQTDQGNAYIDAKQQQATRSKTAVRGWGKIVADGKFVYTTTWLGIHRYTIKNKQLTRPKFIRGTANQTFINMICTSSNHIVGSREEFSGIFTVTNNQFKPIPTFPVNGKMKSVIVTGITKLDSKNVLLTTENHGLLRYSLVKNEATLLIAPNTLANCKIACAIRYTLSGKSVYVIGTRGQGMLIVDPKTHQITNCLPQPERPNSSLCSATIQGLYADANQGIWIATDKGVSYFHPSNQRFKAYFFYRNPVLPENATLNAILQLSESEYFIGTEKDGLYNYNIQQNTAQRISLPREEEVVKIVSLTNQYIAISTTSACYVYNRQNQQFKTLSLPNGGILGCRKLSDKWLGIAMNTGAIIIDWQKNKLVFRDKTTVSNEQSYRSTKDVYLDNSGKLWILRFFNGIECVDLKRNTYENITPTSFLSESLDYHCFSINSQRNQLYVGTTNGILRYDLFHPKAKPVQFQHQNGLAGNLIEQCCVDSSNHILYYTTPTGMYRFDEKKNESYLLHPLEKYRQKYFHTLTMNENTELIATVSNYFAMYNLKNAVYTIPKTPRLESIKIDGKQVSIHQKITISSSKNSLNLNVGTVNFNTNREEQLYYQLLPIQTEWKEVNNGELEFIGLSAGTYKLQIRSKNTATGVLSKPLIQTLKVAAPFYSSWWFVFILFVITTSIIALAFYIRMRNRERILTTRVQLSRDLHDELGANVSSINIMANLLKTTTSETAKEHVFADKIATYSKQINETINDIIWNVNPRFDNTNDLILRMKRFATETLDNTPAEYQINAPSIELEIPLSQDVKYHIYLIFKEAINNCAKYSRADKVNIEFDYSQRIFSFSIEDNGLGFNYEEQNKRGNGLANMHQRAKTIQAQFEIDTELRKGTRIFLSKTL